MNAKNAAEKLRCAIERDETDVVEDAMTFMLKSEDLSRDNLPINERL
jgi:hypothetical protein